MITFSKQLTFGVLASLLPLTLWANSYVYNASRTEVVVYWTAAGCAGYKIGERVCKHGSDDRHPDVSTVCKKVNLARGEGSGYAFKDGTSNRQVYVTDCGNSSDTANTGNKGEKSRCAVKNKNDWRIVVKCNYSQSEFDTLRGK